jgi:hypothetical protein
LVQNSSCKIDAEGKNESLTDYLKLLNKKKKSNQVNNPSNSDDSQAVIKVEVKQTNNF